jgi:Flp pilus assembly protein TadG
VASSHEARAERRREQGNVLVFVTVALVALLGFAAWSTETGQAWTAKGQVQATSDAAALAGAGELLVPNANQPATPGAAVTAAQTYGQQNPVLGVPITIPSADIETGSWDTPSRTFTPLPGQTDPSLVRAVRVLSRRDATANGEVPTVLGQIFGVTGIPVSADAIGYIGYAGSMPPGSAVLPVAIDCCAISGSSCDQDYCQFVAANPPSPCTVNDGGQTATCLEFFASTTQNACWSALDSSDPAVSSADLEDIIRTSNATEASDAIYVDNGTKTSVIQEIHDRFEGSGGHYGSPAGTDLDGDGDSDSWLVPLPILECQNPGDGCASGSNQEIVGITCFDVQEVLTAPSKVIKGQFVCPSDPRFSSSACGVGFGPGGSVPTIDAQWPVLVR